MERSVSAVTLLLKATMERMLHDKSFSGRYASVPPHADISTRMSEMFCRVSLNVPRFPWQRKFPLQRWCADSGPRFQVMHSETDLQTDCAELLKLMRKSRVQHGDASLVYP